MGLLTTSEPACLLTSRLNVYPPSLLSKRRAPSSLPDPTRGTAMKVFVDRMIGRGQAMPGKPACSTLSSSPSPSPHVFVLSSLRQCVQPSARLSRSAGQANRAGGLASEGSTSSLPTAPANHQSLAFAFSPGLASVGRSRKLTMTASSSASSILSAPGQRYLGASSSFSKSNFGLLLDDDVDFFGVGAGEDDEEEDENEEAEPREARNLESEIMADVAEGCGRGVEESVRSQQRSQSEEGEERASD